jgi:hypothetical protein
MSLRAGILAVFPAFLLIGGCGSSTKPTTSHSTPASTAAPAATGTTPTTPATTTSSAATGTTSTQAGGSSGSARGSAQGSQGSGSASGGAASIRVPATFVIGAGGRLSPSTVSSPAFLAVQLTLSSRDGRNHRVEIRAPGLTSLFVPANGRATIRLRGLRAGRYPLKVDGATRGALLIGGEPGP